MSESPAASSSPNEGSVEFVVYRLVRWATNAPYGVAYVAYDSPNVRATAEARFASEVQAEGLTLDRLDLTAFPTVPEAIAALEDKIATTEADVLSVTGFAGFLRALGDDWTPLNYRREDWFQPSVRQVWWVPAAYEADFARRAADLYSWFLIRERLIGSAPKVEPLPVEGAKGRFDPELALKRSASALRRFDRALAANTNLATLLGLATDAARPLYESGQSAEARSLVASLLDRLEYGEYGAAWNDPNPPVSLLERKVGLAALAMQNADRETTERVLSGIVPDAFNVLSPPYTR